MSADKTIINITSPQSLTLESDPNAKKTDIQNPNLWEFPMDYPMSIIGHEGEHESLHNEVKRILNTQFPDFDCASIQVKQSRTGRFSSLRVTLHFTQSSQVNDLYAALDNAKSVRTVV